MNTLNTYKYSAQQRNTDDEGLFIDKNTTQQQTTVFGNDVIMKWDAPEYVHYKKEKNWYVIAGLFLSAIIAYALIKNNPLMAITFILIGAVGYVHLEKKPRILTFKITHDGVMAEKELYEFEDIKSFWIFYEKDFQVISLKTDSYLLPYVHIPIHKEDPLKIRDVLMRFIPEAKHKPSFIDSIERAFHL